eukprot:3433408-Rhodomonas_salina.1
MWDSQSDHALPGMHAEEHEEAEDMETDDVAQHEQPQGASGHHDGGPPPIANAAMAPGGGAGAD